MGDNRMNLKKLCLMGLDDDTDIDIIRELCSGYGTIRDFYRVKGRPELAFVEYSNEEWVFFSFFWCGKIIRNYSKVR